MGHIQSFNKHLLSTLYMTGSARCWGYTYKLESISRSLRKAQWGRWTNTILCNKCYDMVEVNFQSTQPCEGYEWKIFPQLYQKPSLIFMLILLYNDVIVQIIMPMIKQINSQAEYEENCITMHCSTLKYQFLTLILIGSHQQVGK